MDDHDVGVTLTLEDGYRFTADFGTEGVADLLLDEPPPLGGGAGPNPSRILAAAVGNCLGASLLFCLRKSRIDITSLRVHVNAQIVRNEKKRLRIGGIRVRLEHDIPPAQRERAARCLGIFEEFCLVTQSVRDGIDVAVTVESADQPVGFPGAPRGS